MGDIVNLRRARKFKAKSASEKAAAENRRRFGLTKAEKILYRAEASIEDQRFAGHLILDGTGQVDRRADESENRE